MVWHADLTHHYSTVMSASRSSTLQSARNIDWRGSLQSTTPSIAIFQLWSSQTSSSLEVETSSHLPDAYPPKKPRRKPPTLLSYRLGWLVSSYCTPFPLHRSVMYTRSLSIVWGYHFRERNTLMVKRSVWSSLVGTSDFVKHFLLSPFEFSHVLLLFEETLVYGIVYHSLALLFRSSCSLGCLLVELLFLLALCFILDRRLVVASELVTPFVP